MGKNYDITNTQQYSAVPQSNVAADDISKKQDKLMRIFGQFDLNKDGKLNSLELAKAFDYFSSFDIDEDGSDGAGTISKDEFEQGAERLNQELGLTEKDRIKAGDIKKFINKLMNLTQNVDHINIEQLFFFMNEDDEDGEFDIQNITNAEFDSEEEGAYTVTYANGSVVKVKSDNSYEITTKDNQGRTIVTSYNSNKKKLQEVITDASNNVTTIKYEPVFNESTQTQVNAMSEKTVVYNNGDTETTQYVTFESEPLPSVVTQVSNKGKTTAVMNYTLGIKCSVIITTGDTELTYIGMGEDQRLARKTENKGSENETVTVYNYDDNAHTINVTIQNGSRVVKQLREFNNPNDARTAINDDTRIIYEDIQEMTAQGIRSSRIFYLAEGRGNARLEEVIEPSGRKTVTEYNQNNRKINCVLVQTGNEIEATYDGNGNTYMVFTIDDPSRITRLARAFNTTPAAIYALNKSQVHTDSTTGAKYFIAGARIKIPGELAPDTPYLQARGSQEYETQRGNQLWDEITTARDADVQSRQNSLVRTLVSNHSTFRDFAKFLYSQEGENNPNRYLLDARVDELKQLNPNIQDGQLSGKSIRFKYEALKESQVSMANIENYHRQLNQRKATEARTGAVIADNLYKYIDDNSYAIDDTAFWDILNTVTSSNIVGVIESYNSKHPNKGLMTFIYEEWTHSSNSELNKNAQRRIIRDLISRAQSSGMDPNNISATYSRIENYIKNANSDQLEHEIKYLCEQIRLAEEMSPEEKAQNSQLQTANATLDAGMMQYNIANDAYQARVDANGWCANTWNWFKNVFGSENTTQIVGGKVVNYKEAMVNLENIYKTQGFEAFKTAFKSTFNVEYDAQLTLSYTTKMKNLQTVQELSNLYNTISKPIGPNGTSVCSYNGLINGYTALIQKLEPSIKNPRAAVEELIKNKMESRGYHYTAEYSQEKFIFLRNMVDEVLGGLRQQMSTLSNGKSIDQMSQELAQQGAALFGANNDIMHTVVEYVKDQTKGEGYINAATKIAAMVAIGIVTGGAGWGPILIAGGATTATSFAVDASDRLSSNNGLTMSQTFDFLGSALVDGLFAAGGTWMRNGLKEAKFMGISDTANERIGQFINFKGKNLVAQQGILITGDTSVSTTSSALNGNFSAKNLAYCTLWSTLAHGVSCKIPKRNVNGMKLDFSRGARRLTKGVDKERRVSNREVNVTEEFAFNPQNIHAIEVSINSYIRGITNLGDLNSTRRLVESLPEEGREDLITAIEERQQELLNNRSLITVDDITISPEVRSNAIAALNQSAEHLLPEQLNDIMDYIDSITNPQELNSAIILLQRHGIDLNEDCELRNVLDDKFAELQMNPPYKVSPTSVIYAYTTNPINSGQNTSPEQNLAENHTPSEAVSLNTPILDRYATGNRGTVTQLDPTNFFMLKEELQTCIESTNDPNILAMLSSKLNFLENSSQRNELLRILTPNLV